jgi:predicted nucleic-acid-binding protein
MLKSKPFPFRKRGKRHGIEPSGRNMARKLIDANAILRYLLRDDEGLFQKAVETLEKARTGEERAIILESVLTECVYVLLKVYKVKRSLIAQKLGALLRYKGVVNSDKQDLIDSIKLFGETRLSFVDCLLCIKSKNNDMPIVTFDEELRNISKKA